MKYLLNILLTVVLALLALGCGTSRPYGGDGGSDGDGSGTDGYSGCRKDADCAAPTPRCQLSSGICVACLGTADCAVNETCMGGECQPGTIVCTSDADCGTGHCDIPTGTCVECLNDRQCPTDFVCTAGQCKPKGGIPCVLDSDCTLGELCIDRACAAGCRSTRDCPPGLLCDPASGAHGACVQCLTQEDCPGGFRCVDGLCQFSCGSDADCPGRHCDPDSKQCVDCLVTDHCALGTVCDQQYTCVPGCRSTRDCPLGLLCDTASAPLGACVECLQDSDCAGVSEGCRGGSCVLLCTSDVDCAGLHCEVVSGQCVECLAIDDCQLGNICAEDHRCVPGCLTSRDCPQPLKCDPQLGPNGSCIQCLADTDCGAGTKCVQNRCVQSCGSDADCPIGHCDLASGNCVECTQDAHCTVGYVCLNASCTPGCRNASGCPSSQKCDLSTIPGRCVDCLADSDCLQGGSCTGGTCLYAGKQCGEACTGVANECAQGLNCGLFFQTCLPLCATNADCPGSQCFPSPFGGNGICLACPPPICDPPCVPGQECLQGECVKKCFPPCDFGFSCDNGTCQPVATDCNPACLPGEFCWSQVCQQLQTDGCPTGMIYLQFPGVCIDRFEASLRDGSLGNADGTGVTATEASISGAVPIANVTYHQARLICRNSGKRLCLAPEWQALCAGPGNYTYPYGDSYLEGACHSNTQHAQAVSTGSYIECISSTGAVDLSGNVWEWTDTPYSSANNRKILGGGFGSTPENSTCNSDLNLVNGAELPLTEARESLGFRCCLIR